MAISLQKPPPPPDDDDDASSPSHHPPPSSRGEGGGCPIRLRGLELIHPPLGEGGFGVVWKARSIAFGCLVAIKILLWMGAGASQQQQEQALAEARIWKFLSDEAYLADMDVPLLKMYSACPTEDGRHFCILMELCSGGTLADAITESASSSSSSTTTTTTTMTTTTTHVSSSSEEEKAAALAHSMARALHFCHVRGVLHLDVKPENILFPSAECRGTWRGARLADFGLAQLFPAAGTEKATHIFRARYKGTCGYMAPEVITHGAYSPAADAWSLGAVLLRALTGFLPPHDPYDPTDLIAHFEDWGECSSNSSLAGGAGGAGGGGGGGRWSWLDEYMKEGVLHPRISCRWNAMSAPARDALKGLLTPHPAHRLTLPQLLSHPWLAREKQQQQQQQQQVDIDVHRRSAHIVHSSSPAATTGGSLNMSACRGGAACAAK